MDELYLDKTELIELASRISDGSATDEDIRKYNLLHRHFQAEGIVVMEDVEAKLLEEDMIAQINQELFHRANLRLRFWITRIAASIVLIGTLVATFYYFSRTPVKTETIANILPGSNKATLILANGRKVLLAETQGVISLGTDGRASNDTAGILKYEGMTAPAGGLGFNSVETPRGGIYQLKLADGTKVWLNSASKLHYPVVYAESERVVELEGEAYFEVAKIAGKPFKVKSKGQVLEVLGTHFNLNSYHDEPYITTTLLEGAVVLSSSDNQLILRPMQQALYRKGQFRLKKVEDVDEVLAWKNGYFQFDDEDLESVLRKISRWYDVDIRFVGTPTEQKFNGSISRSKGIKKALEVIEATGNVNFRIEGRTLIVKI